ncbi:MAG: helix-turn-helix transcriptional regulator [Bacteroidetes bacterium]|nr:helix-turn-helix transcriptional regulator [Bacteroidota bacterium]
MQNSTTINAAMGKAVKVLRIHLKYKQDYLANSANITVKTLSNIENGRAGIDIDKLHRISACLNIPISLILDLAMDIVKKREEN